MSLIVCQKAVSDFNGVQPKDKGVQPGDKGSVLGTKLLKKTTLKTVQIIVGILLFTTAIGLIGGLL